MCMFVYVYILNKINASNNAVALILMDTGGNPFSDKHTKWQHGLTVQMPAHLYGFILLSMPGVCVCMRERERVSS